MSTKELAEKNLIYKVKVGSHAYGTALPTSDVDYAGIFIPPIEYFFGLAAFDLLCSQEEEDKSYYSLRKYANLAVANNPNVLELLFVSPEDVCFSAPPADELRTHRHLFLSQRCQKTFVGYAKAQLHRIRTHTKWLAQEFDDMLKLEPMIRNGLVTKEWVAWRFGGNMLERVRDLEFSNTTRVGDEQSILANFKSSNIICPNKNDERFLVDDTRYSAAQGALYPVKIFQKHVYDEAKKKRDQYVTWMAERNPIRHETEIKFGYDTKHAMHLVRLLRAGYEILTTGDLLVKRPDAAELLDIRAGKWTYEEVVSYADEMVAKIDGLPAEQIKVPAHPDTNKINNLVVQITKEHLWKIKP